MELKLEPKDSYKGVDTLCREFPDKTAKEILELHEHDKKCNRLWVEKGQEKIRAFAKKINDAGAMYYKGRFGLDQRYYYRISNAEVTDRGDIYADIKKIVCFMGDEGSGKVFEGNIRIEKESKEHTSIQNYSLENERETTQEDWDKISNYLESVSDFWNDIKWG